MASWIIHLRVADKLVDIIRNVDKEKFIVGNIAPDCGEFDENKKIFIPPKSITHWKPKQDSLRDEFYNKYLSQGEMNIKTSFYLGYYVHLYTDTLWKFQIYRPTKEKFLNNFDNEHELNYKMKADWFDIDHMYLRDNPNFRSFNILQNIKSFPNIYLDYFSKQAFENKIKFISYFYNNNQNNLNREYPFLNKYQADAFVENATKAIKNDLISKHLILI